MGFWRVVWLFATITLLEFSAALPASSLERRATAGCGKTRLYLGVTQYRSVQSGGRERSYSIHLPWNYNRNNAYPVVVGFHGSSSIGFFFEADTRLSLVNDKIMVYPTAFEGNWAGPSYANLTVAEDLQFVDDLMYDVQAEFCTDEKRFYATGISNGGGFVNDIACSDTGARFAAFAPASGSFYTDRAPDSTCKPSRSPLPVLEIHGGNDKSVAYAGGQGSGGILPAIPDWVSVWATRNGCTSSQTVDSFEGRVHHTSWDCGQDPASSPLQHLKIDPMGHCWASTSPNFSQLSVPEGPTLVEANDIILDFFNQHALP